MITFEELKISVSREVAAWRQAILESNGEPVVEEVEKEITERILSSATKFDLLRAVSSAMGTDEGSTYDMLLNCAVANLPEEER